MNFYRKYAEGLFHIAGWALFILFPFYFFGTERPMFSVIDQIGSALVLIFYFYLNMYLFVPRLLNEKKYLLFLLSITAGFFLIYLTNYFLFNPKFDFKPEFEFEPPFKKRPHGFLKSFFSFVFIFTTSTFIRLFQIWRKDQKAQDNADQERIKSELSYLKLQISPHFLYNSLNSIYSLAVEKSDKTAEVVLKLSELTRYMTYTSEQKYVHLDEEIAHLENFISLQKIRLIDDVIVDFKFETDKKNDIIEPMLLIPFIENAFKHGISYSNNAEINIHLSVKNHKLHFAIKNQMFQTTSKSISEDNSGIGLPNVKRRLELLYPDKHNLNISQTEKEFEVKLNIDLKEI